MAEGRGSINWSDSGEEVSYKENAHKNNQLTEIYLTMVYNMDKYNREIIFYMNGGFGDMSQFT